MGLFVHPFVRRLVVPLTTLSAAALTAVTATAVKASSAEPLPAASSAADADASAHAASVRVGDFNVEAARCNGGALAAEPNLAHGEIIVVTVPGFAPGAAVQVRVAFEAASPIQPHADPAGVLRLVYQVPTSLSQGPHLLTLSGPGPQQSSALAGNISVTVPNTGLLHFRVNPAQSNGPQCDLVPTPLY